MDTAGSRDLVVPATCDDEIGELLELGICNRVKLELNNNRYYMLLFLSIYGKIPIK